MAAHINETGEFQSDKYPACPPGKVPLSVKDKTAQDLLWEYAQRRRAVDAEFSEDLEASLRAKGYDPRPTDERTDAVRYALREAFVRHLEACGYTVPLKSIPNEYVAETFSTMLAARGYAIVGPAPK